MFGQILSKIGNIQPMLRLPAFRLFSWNICSTNSPSNTPRNLSSTNQLRSLPWEKHVCLTNRLHQSTISRSLCSITQPSMKQVCGACSIHQSTMSRSLCSITQPSMKQACSACSIHHFTMSRSLCSGNFLANSLQKNGECTAVLTSNVSAPLNNLLIVRNLYRVYYRPSALKRMRKHGLEKRLSKRSQKEILFRRILKGRQALSTFDRFMNELPERKKTGKRVNLFDPKRGYKSRVRRNDYFVFTEV